MNRSTWIILTVILLVGFYFRTILGLDWDEGQHLHPDERFLTMVSEGIRFPDSIADYFNSKTSPLSPYNNNYGFFVYGTFPIFLTKAVAETLALGGYGSLHLVGRVVSSLFDLATVLVLFLIGAKLYSPQIGLLAAALLALSVLNIQLSHFYGVEIQVAFFIVVTFYLALWAGLPRDGIARGEAGVYQKFLRLPLIYLAIGVSFGLALACKISALFFVFFLAIMSVCDVIRFCKLHERRGTLNFGLVFYSFSFQALLAAAGLLVSALVFRIFQPYAFAGSSFFNFEFAEKFLSNMREIKGLMAGADYPPSIQWVDRTPVLFSLKNMVNWYMGIPLGITVCAAVLYCTYEIIWRKKYLHSLVILWAVFWFVRHGMSFAQTGRYLIVVYPFLILSAAYFLIELGSILANALCTHRAISPFSRWIKWSPAGLVLFGTLLWAVAFTNIYRAPVSRVAASRWIYKNIPCGTVVGNEHWDDPLPLRIDGQDGFGGCYRGVEFNHYWPDDQHKLEDTLKKLSEVEYIILSSNRLYLSIPRLPRRFPFTIRYYEMLFSGDLGFDHIETFSSYPKIFGIEFNSDYADESFTVYDHPKVLIFKKSPRFNAERIKEVLSSFPPGVIEPLV